MGGVRFLISALISKQISDFWTQVGLISELDFKEICFDFS